MLVIISDLHLTDGTTGTTIGAGAFLDFRERLRSLAFDASYRSDGTYRPIERIELLLLGDVFDLLRSTRWNEEQEGDRNFVRPWDEPQSRRFVRKLHDITMAALRYNEEALEILHQLTGSNPIKLPPATADGQPALDTSEQIPVQVRLHYMVGNHDWYYHLPGPLYEQMRQEVRQKLGLSNPSGPFPHDPSESPMISDIFEQYRVFARHGDIFDAFNYDPEKGRDGATLGDAVVVELINRFPREVHHKLGDVLPAPFVDGLNELANVRPSLLVPVWIDSLVNHIGLSKAQSNEVKRIWNELADYFLELPFVRQQDKAFRFDEVDLLQLTLRFARQFSFSDAARVITLVREKILGGSTSYARHALSEAAFKNQKAHHIIYGHTHHHEVIPLHKTFLNERTLNQLYFNSGTWHAVHELAIHQPINQRFIHFQVMSYLAFFKGDERKGRPFETWSGTLSTREGS